MDDNHDTLRPKFVNTENINFKSSIALKTAEALENLKWRVKGCTLAWVKEHKGMKQRMKQLTGK